MSDEQTCIICQQGTLESRCEKNPIRADGKTVYADLHYSVCDYCGCEQTTDEQSVLNKLEGQKAWAELGYPGGIREYMHMQSEKDRS